MYVEQDAVPLFDSLGGFEGLGEFGALAVHAGVTVLQKYLNNFAEQASFAPLSTKGQYGGCTHTALKKFCKWAGSLYGLAYVGDATVDSAGPMIVVAFLKNAIPPYAGLSDANMLDAAAAFTEWKAAGAPACGTTSGVGSGDETAKADDGTAHTGIVGGGTAKAGLGILGWALIGVGGVAAAAVIYHYATRNRQPAPAHAMRRY